MDKVLVLFSGGKDSFLTAAQLVVDGYQVELISFNGGALAHEENLLHGVERLQRAYGSDYIYYAGIYPTVGTVQRLGRYWAEARQSELAEKWPELSNCQVTCLHCQTAMWAAAIAYAKAHKIPYIACGYKDADVFCTGVKSYRQAIEKVAEKYQVWLRYPVLNMPSDFDRDMKMERFGFEPSVLEPKCLLGRPPRDGVLKDPERQDMMRYFEGQLRSEMEAAVERLIPILGMIQLGPSSWGKSTYQALKEIEGKES